MTTGFRNGHIPENECNNPRTRPIKNWKDIICQDLKSIGVAWEDAEQFILDREAWHEHVAQCVLIDTG